MEPAHGWLRMFPDVAVRQSGENEWIGISREPAVPGETLVLDVMMAGTAEGELRKRFRVCVIDSRPIFIDGDMRHRIRLHSGDLALVRFDEQVRRG